MRENHTTDDEADGVSPWKFREAVENAGHAVLFTDLDGTIEYVNPAFEELTGYEASEVVGRDPSILSSGEHEDAFYDDLWRTITEGTVWQGELVDERKSGERIVIDQTVAPVVRDGERVGYVAINTDITEKRERERKIEALHEATRNLLAADSPEEIAGQVGQAVQEILGFPINVVRLCEGSRLEPVHVDERTRDLLGERPVYEVGEGPAGEAFQNDEAVVVDDATAVGDDYDRSPVRSWLYVPLGRFGVLSVGRTEPAAFEESDVTLVRILSNNAEAALRAIERERELARENERLERFASTVSHDLRNPLNVAEGTLDQMRSFSDQLDRMTRAHERMEEVIEGVLTLARQGERVEETTRVDVARLARRCWDHVSSEGVHLVVVDDDELALEADESRLKHLLENLFRNAITHGAASTVTVGRLDGAGFYVADDGDGIPPEARDRVFETGYTTRAEGTGLGLSIVREIAEAHGWRVRVTESETGGARFEFTGVEFE